MAQSSAAAVIDLEEFRRRRGARAQARPRTTGLSPAAFPFPCWIVWVPVWFVA